MCFPPLSERTAQSNTADTTGVYKVVSCITVGAHVWELLV